MVNLIIDNRPVQVPENTSILAAAADLGIKIPTLCYLKDINEIGACRVCVVEVEGSDRLCAACDTPVEEGMVVRTNSRRVREARKATVEMILSQHDGNCVTCLKNGNCTLQSVARELNINSCSYEKKIPAGCWDMTLPLIRNESKCIKCMRCVNVCEKIQSVGVWKILEAGSRTTVGTKEAVPFNNTACTFCGQCIAHCPVGALTERDDTEKAFNALMDPEKITVIQIAPAVRAAWGEALGLPKKAATVKRLVAAMKAVGADYVFDTDFTADLTILEEGSEFVAQFGKKKPLFTSCCPGWVRFVKQEYPDMAGCLSSAKSPQQMFGAVAKSYFAEVLGVDPARIFCISIMPCTAKKYECDVPELSDAGAGQDVDLVLTTREMARLIKMSGVNAEKLEEADFDQPLGLGTGAGVIFGATGGVMEAALRSACYLMTGKNPDPDAFHGVRYSKGIKSYEVSIGDHTVKAAVVNGLGNARKLMETIRAGEADYDFVEVMACPGGCVGGGGQPVIDGCELAEGRAVELYELDKEAPLRFSHENPFITEIYEKYFGAPLSEKAHHLLHTDQAKWTLK